jgi:hypothetical protein
MGDRRWYATARAGLCDPAANSLGSLTETDDAPA